MTNPITDPIFTRILNENDHPTRKNLIKLIEDKLDGKVICYFANPEHPYATISNDDVILFEDLLRSTGDSKKGILILNSSGGNGNAAEKLLSMCRERFTENFTVVVPNFAKSAATMMCLGADKIMMGYLAELGPIDPQISLPGNFAIPARSFIDGLEMVRKNVQAGDPPNMYLFMLQKVRPEIISICTSAIADAECFAESWLSRYMLKENPEQAKKVAKWLSDGETYKSHGKVINHKEAKEILKLNVELIDLHSELWYWIWELYVRSIVNLKTLGPDTAKMFESFTVSLTTSMRLPQQK